MTAKEKAIRTIEEMPSEASLEDIMEQLYVLGKIERGMGDAAAGRVVEHAEVKRRLAQWIEG